MKSFLSICCTDVGYTEEEEERKVDAIVAV